jgi:serine/threonine protein kinase
LVNYIDYFDHIESNKGYLVMEKAGGTTLEEFIKKNIKISDEVT